MLRSDSSLRPPTGGRRLSTAGLGLGSIPPWRKAVQAVLGRTLNCPRDAIPPRGREVWP